MILEPVRDAQGRPLDQIRLIGLSARGFHGVLPDERRDGQSFSADVVLHLDTRAAAATDDLADTVDYGVLGVALAAILRGEPVALVERLADRLARRCLLDERVAAADVALHKPDAPIPEDFADVVLAVRRTRVPAVLALGANLGERDVVLQAAVDDLAAVPGLTVLAVSPVVETAPVGGPDQPDYLNLVVSVSVALSPQDLLATAHEIERSNGRERRIRWGARTLDIDIISYDDLRVTTDELELPHPRAHERAFVLAPWAAMDPAAELITPDGARPVADLLARAADRDGVRLRPDLHVRVPR